MPVASNLNADATSSSGLPAAEPEPQLEVRDLTVDLFTSRGKVRAVDAVSFQVHAGETLALVGESGSGKTMTGLGLLRLVPHAPHSRLTGSVLYRDRSGTIHDLARTPDAKLRALRGRELSMVFQDPSGSLNPVLRVGEQICEALNQHLDLSRQEARRRSITLLQHVGIANAEQRFSQFPHQLSGGMKQRVVIAIAVACNPALIVADEPTTALDVSVEAQIVALLGRLQDEHGLALIFISHNLALVSQIADRIAVMYAGQIVEEGPADELLTQPCHPYTRALLACTPRLDDPGGKVLSAIPGQVPHPLAMPRGCRFHSRCTYARDACRTTAPAFEQVNTEHRVRCLFWRENISTQTREGRTGSQSYGAGALSQTDYDDRE